MILRIDRLPVDLPIPDAPNANAASAVQELMGGKFGEMSTLMNYTFQSFNFRGKTKFRPFYDLLCNIAAEEHSHIELVAATIGWVSGDEQQPALKRHDQAGGSTHGQGRQGKRGTPL